MLIHPCQTGFKRGVSLLSAVVVSGRSETAVLTRSKQASLIFLIYVMPIYNLLRKGSNK